MQGQGNEKQYHLIILGAPVFYPLSATNGVLHRDTLVKKVAGKIRREK